MVAITGPIQPAAERLGDRPAQQSATDLGHFHHYRNLPAIATTGPTAATANCALHCGPLRQTRHHGTVIRPRQSRGLQVGC